LKMNQRQLHLKIKYNGMGFRLYLFLMLWGYSILGIKLKIVVQVYNKEQKMQEDGKSETKVKFVNLVNGFIRSATLWKLASK
jgi:hypothetical protein